MAKSELAVLTTQYLEPPFPDEETLANEVVAWQAHRNKHHTKADSQFTTPSARVKLKGFYPQFELLAQLPLSTPSFLCSASPEMQLRRHMSRLCR